MDLYFIRHGQTHYNVEGKYYGRLDPPLTAAARDPVIQLAAGLASLDLDAIYCSSLQRSRQTAHLLCQANGWPADLIHSCPKLDEMDFGQWEGLTADQIQDRYPDEWQHFMTHPLQLSPGGGEDVETFQGRVLEGFNQIVQSHPHSSCLLVVGHLGALRTILHAYFESQQSFFDIQFNAQTIKHYRIEEKLWEGLF